MSNIGKNRDYKTAAEEAHEHMVASPFPWHTTFREAFGLRRIAVLDIELEMGGGAKKAVKAAILVDQYGKPCLVGFEHDGRLGKGITLPLYEMRGVSVDELMSAAENCCGMTSKEQLGRLDGKHWKRISPLEFYLGSMLLAYSDADHPWERVDGGEDRYGLVMRLTTPDGSLACELQLTEVGTVMLSLFDNSAPNYPVIDMGRRVRLVKFFDDTMAAINEAVRVYDEATK